MYLRRPTAAALAVVFTLTACKTLPTAQRAAPDGAPASATGELIHSCLTGAAVGAVVGAAVELFKARNSGQKNSTVLLGNKNDLLKAAAAGCVINLAITAVGKLMDARQQAKHEEAMQAEARRRALEQQNYAATTPRVQAMPAATPAQRSARDASLERARAEYEASIARPVNVDLGNGGQSTIQVAAPAATPAATPTAGGAAARPATCQDFSVLVTTPAGRAKQFETWCPNAQGRMVRTEAREATA
jgi:gas vesicle protein